jgi:hypothetical protein
MKANKTMKGKAVPKNRRRKDKESEGNIDSAAQSNQRKLNDRNHHHIPVNTNTEC